MIGLYPVLRTTNQVSTNQHAVNSKMAKSFQIDSIFMNEVWTYN